MEIHGTREADEVEELLLARESDVVDGGRVLFALTLSENSYFFGVVILTNCYYLFVY